MLCPCHAPTMPFFSRPQHSTALTRRPCCAVALRRTAWSEHGMASVNQTRPHCVNQMGTTHSKPLAVRHGRGTAWARHAMCESAFRLPSRPFAATKCGSRNNSNNSDINMSSAIGHTAIICNLRQFCLLYLCKASLVSCPGTRQLYHMESLHPPGRHVTAILLR